MGKISRRQFLKIASAGVIAGVTARGLAASSRQRVFVGSNTQVGILAYDWDPVTAELTPAGVAATLSNVDWVTASAFAPDHVYLFAASEVDSFNGKPTGGVASYRMENGRLQPISARNSAGKGTCHVALDHSGRVLLAADYGGGSAASFLIDNAGSLSPAVWTEHYTAHGPDASRQESAHAHFASFSPDNGFAYINDLGGDCIHIYRLNAATAMLVRAGTYHARSGAGPRTLHFHPNGHTAYSVNELNSTVDVLDWHMKDGSLTLVTRVELLPAQHSGVNTACDTVISKDGRSVYFANRGTDFLFTCKADPRTGALTPIGPTSCGGKTPRSFTLDPTERWMLVANQDSNQISVFARNAATGVLAEQGKNYPAAAPMCILFA